uniref:Secreted protein n=1 Tax=Steinernema glaseri TaxID=37863 RepID=A0A1I8AM69_9BILA
MFLASFSPDSGFSSPSCSKSLSLPCFSCGESSRAFRRLPFSGEAFSVDRTTQTEPSDSFDPRTARFISDCLARMGDRFEREFFVADVPQPPSPLDNLLAWILQLWL